MIKQFIHIDSYGDKWYYKDKTLNTQHRVDGPAVERSSGTKYWFVDGKLHRVDGPAVEWSDGTKSWYLDGVNFSEVEFNEKINPIKKYTLICNEAVGFGRGHYVTRFRHVATNNLSHEIKSIQHFDVNVVFVFDGFIVPSNT